jgi:hypothetical protein
VLRHIEVKESRFGFEPEITAKVAKLAKYGVCRMYEVGISYNGRTYAEGKKITWKDGFAALKCIVKYNLFDKHYDTALETRFRNYVPSHLAAYTASYAPNSAHNAA